MNPSCKCLQVFGSPESVSEEVKELQEEGESLAKTKEVTALYHICRSLKNVTPTEDAYICKQHKGRYFL